MKSLKEVCYIAANWWADVVCNPKFDNGDKRSQGFLASALACMGTQNVSMEKHDKFRDILANKLEKIFTDKTTQKEYYCTDATEYILYTDYSPCRLLSEAAKEAGVPDTQFPWKTSMYVGLNYISVRYGYGAERTYLYETKEYWKSRLGKAISALESTKKPDYYDFIKDPKEREQSKKDAIREYLTDIEKCKKCIEQCEE